MVALPIAGRELLVLSRAATTWRNRLANSGVIVLCGIGFAVLYHYAGQVGLAQAMRLIGVGLSIMCLFAGVSLTADAIAEEKRAGTLGLLFLTHLTPFEVVLGKLVAHGVLGFYMVICALPLLSMSMIFGGMRFSDVVLTLLGALNLLFLSSAAGLFASAVCREKRRAHALGTLIMVFFWQGLPLLALLLKPAGAPQPLIDLIGRLSVNLFGAFGLARFLPSTPKWWNFAWPHVLGWAFIAMAVWCLPRFWQDEPSKRRGLREIWKAICYGSSKARLRLRRKLLDRNAFMWLASRDRLQVAGMWIVSVCAITLVGFILLRGTLQPMIAIAPGIAIAFLLQLGFSQAATAQLLREYEQGTLEMILSTPLSTEEVAAGQVAAARRQYRSLCAAVMILFCTGALLLVWQSRAGWFFGLVMLAAYAVLFLVQFQAIGWVSVWSVVKAADPKKAASNGFFLVSILPGMMWGAVLGSLSFAWWLISVRFPVLAAGMLFSPGPEILFPPVFILAFVNCIYWSRRAKREVPQQLRPFAFQRYTPPGPVTFFGQIGRLLGRLWGRAAQARATERTDPSSA